MPAPDPSPLGAVEEALRKYGRHEEWCLKAQIGVDAKCCCGFSAALAAAARMREWAVRLNQFPTKGGRPWTKVLVLPLPPGSEEVSSNAP